jgi:hypothetical protein
MVKLQYRRSGTKVQLVLYSIICGVMVVIDEIGFKNVWISF